MGFFILPRFSFWYIQAETSYNLAKISNVVQMTVTWTSGYNIDEAVPFVEWHKEGGRKVRSPAGTLTFSRWSMCGMIRYEWLCCIRRATMTYHTFFSCFVCLENRSNDPLSERDCYLDYHVMD